MSACDECGDLFMLESELESHIQTVHAAPEGVERSTSSPERPRVDPSKPVTKERALELLREGIGPSAEFRPQQWEAIDRLANNKERLLIVERTGWGKSTVYFITTRLLRDRGAGPTLIVSPLLALMRDQIKNAEEQFGLEAITINSSNTAEWERAKQAVLGGTCDVLLISPERFANREFRTTVLNEMTQGFGMLVVDEAHCISNWGHDFRPDYRRMKRIVERLPENVPVAATTATANDRVVEDVTTQLPDLSAIRGSLVRDSLSIQTIDLGSRERRLAWLAENVPKTTGSGIIYCLTTRDVEQVAEWLAGQGLSVLPYHGSLGQQVRIEREQKLLANQVDALVATNALGMGFDKPDLGVVIHFQRPPNLIRYYQEIGRAGRDLEEATAILLSGEDDDAIARYFIETAFPPAEVFEKVLSAISQSQEPMRDRAILREADVRYGQVSKCTDILQVEGAIKRQDSGYSRTANPWNYDGQRFQQVTAARWAELERIQEFTETEDCLTQFVDDALDGDLGKPCGQCANCTGEGLPTEIQDQQLLRDAVRYYQKGDGFEISPRKQQHVRGGTRTRIPEEERIESGRALAIWDQPGWGSKVKDGKYEKGRFDDELVEAAERFIREEWEPSPDPAWIAAVPSTTNDGLVADFATRLGRRLDIPFVNCLEKVKRTQQQKELNNSYQKCWNVQGAFDADITVLSADVLLVDDVVGSRWTLTEAGRMLRTAGSDRVYPFALAMRRGG
jgi:ATP-dependent DNA helicase RecQ